MLSYAAEEFKKSVKQEQKDPGKSIWNAIKSPEFIAASLSLFGYIFLCACGVKNSDYALIFYIGAAFCGLTSVISGAFFQHKQKKQNESFYSNTLKAIWIPHIESQMKNLGISLEACGNTLKEEIEKEICEKEKRFERISHTTAETLKLLFIAPAGFLFGLVIESLYTVSVSDMKLDPLMSFSKEALYFSMLIAVSFLPICGLIIIIASFWDLLYTIFSGINFLENCVMILDDIAILKNQKCRDELKQQKKSRKKRELVKQKHIKAKNRM